MRNENGKFVSETIVPAKLYDTSHFLQYFIDLMRTFLRPESKDSEFGQREQRPRLAVECFTGGQQF